jgi:hypothetical protein
MQRTNPKRVFLLSPASTAGRRARILLSPSARFALALQVRAPQGERIGEVFSFLSGLYFRGKLAYARRFAQPGTAIRIITSDRGLVSPDLRVTLDDLTAMSQGAIDPRQPGYRLPLERDLEALDRGVARGAEVVLLGSIATEKYVGILQSVLGERLVFPEAFVGRGDMSRGGLLLRAVREDQELAYQALLGAIRRGKRPARLTPVPRDGRGR